MSNVTKTVARYGAYLQDESHSVIRVDVARMEDKELFSLGAKVDAVASVIRDEQDRRIRVWHGEGLSQRAIAVRAGCAQKTVSRRYQALGLQSADPRGGHGLSQVTQNGDIDPGELLPDEGALTGADIEVLDAIVDEPEPTARALDVRSTIDQWRSGAMVFRLKAARAELTNYAGARDLIAKLRLELDQIEELLP